MPGPSVAIAWHNPSVQAFRLETPHRPGGSNVMPFPTPYAAERESDRGVDPAFRAQFWRLALPGLAMFWAGVIWLAVG